MTTPATVPWARWFLLPSAVFLIGLGQYWKLEMVQGPHSRLQELPAARTGLRGGTASTSAEEVHDKAPPTTARPGFTSDGAHSESSVVPISAAIVEPRCHPALPLVIANLHASLPDVPVQLFYSRENEGYARDELLGLLSDFFRREETAVSAWLSWRPLPGGFFEEGIRNTINYTNLLVMPGFWDLITGEKVLVFQTDSWLCRQAAAKLSQFMDVDFVGAPFSRPFGNLSVGNGGLSFRTRRVMREVAATADTASVKAAGAEDVYFCSRIQAGMGRLASKMLAARFSNRGGDPFGVHRVWTWHSWAYDKLLPKCLGMDTVRTAQSLEKTCGVGDRAARARGPLERYRKQLGG